MFPSATTPPFADGPTRDIVHIANGRHVLIRDVKSQASTIDDIAEHFCFKIIGKAQYCCLLRLEKHNLSLTSGGI
jgi:hypothetical protein